MFRYIEVKSNGNMLVEHITTLQLVYRLCVPADMSRWHVKMLPAVRDELMRSDLVLVSYDDQPDPQTGLFTACYIQDLPRGLNTPYAQVPVPDGRQPVFRAAAEQPAQIPAEASDGQPPQIMH